MGNLWTKVFKHKDVRILLLGLDGAGKTTLLYRIKLGEVITHVPTIGFNVEQLQYKNITFTAWDIGARDKMRPLFRHYYKGTDAVVVVIDGSDPERLDELYCDILKPALHAEELAHSVFLFLVNKRDLPDTVDMAEVSIRLNLKSVKQIWNIVETSATRGDGLTESMDWLTNQLGSKQTSRGKNFYNNLPSISGCRTSGSTISGASTGRVDPLGGSPSSSPRDSPQHTPQHVRKHATKQATQLQGHEFDTLNGSRMIGFGSNTADVSPLKDRSPTRDYCNRAYSAFKCFFIRPSVPPDIED